MKRKKNRKLSHNGEDENDGGAEVTLKQQTKTNDDAIDPSKNSSTKEPSPSRKRKKKKKSKKRKEKPKDTELKNSPNEEVALESRPTKKSKRTQDQGNNDCDDESSKNSSKEENPAETSRPRKKRKKTKKNKKQQKDETALHAISNTTTVEDRKTNTTNSITNDNQKQGKVISSLSSSSLPNSEHAIEFPYEVDPDDHCESPLAAYQDILPLLHYYRRRKNKLSIYDPYFCNGRVALHLESLGFPDVYNRKEDCYKVWKNPSVYPNYDVFLTNPPYSGDHIEKLMKHVTGKQNKGKPWMLLMPNFVHKKDYFLRLTSSSGQLPIYLVPKKRYVYLPPPNMRDKKASSTHKKSSPFVSMWYLWGGSREITNDWYNLLRKQRSTAFDVARSKSALRDLRRKHK